MTVTRDSSTGEHLDGVLVGSDRVGALTDSSGRAVLLLAPGNRELSVTRHGFRPLSLTVALRAGSTVRSLSSCSPRVLELESVVVSSYPTIER